MQAKKFNNSTNLKGQTQKVSTLLLPSLSSPQQENATHFSQESYELCLHQPHVRVRDPSKKAQHNTALSTI
jgi:hypothetical protein